MNTCKFFLRSLLNKFRGKRPARDVAPAPRSGKCTSARERVRNGIEPLEGRIAPAILVNAHMLTYHDADGDLVTVNFSKDIFDFDAVTLPAALDAVFKFSAGKAHKGAANATDDVPQQLQLIDLGKAPLKIVHGNLKSRVAGVSVTITSAVDPASGMPPGDGFAAIGAIKAGNNALGSVTIDGDLGQIDAGVGSAKTGIEQLTIQSIGKFGTSTQRPGATPPTADDPAPDLESKIIGQLGKLMVTEDMQGYIHVLDSTVKRGTIGKIVVGGSLLGNPTVGAASDNTGRIEAAFDIGKVSIGADFMDGIHGGAGKNSGTLSARHAIAKITISGSITGGAGDGSGVIASGGTLDAVSLFGSITGSGSHSGGIRAVGNIESVTLAGGLTGGAGAGSGFIEGLKHVRSVFVGGDVLGNDGDGSGVIVGGSKLKNVTIDGQLRGGKGANSGSILGGHDPGSSSRSLGNVTLTGPLIGGEGNSSGAIGSGGSIGVVTVGAEVTASLAMQGGIGALSGSIFAGGAIGSVTIFQGVEGGVGPGSASIQSHGLLGSVAIGGDLTGGTGTGSASIFSHEISSIARPVAGDIGSVSISGTLAGDGDRTAFIQADGKLGSVTAAGITGGAGSYSGAIVSGVGLVSRGATSFITVAGMVEGGNGDHSGYVEIGGRLGTFTAGGLMDAGIRVANDLGLLKVSGNVIDSIIAARGESGLVGKTDVAIGSVKIGGSVSNTSILAGYDVFGSAANAHAQIGEVRVTGNWTASVLAAGVVAGTDGLFGTADDRLMAGAHRGKIIATIAKVIVGGIVEGTLGTSDHFGFIAELIGSFSSNGSALALTKSGGQTFELGTHTDTTVREVVFV